MVKTGVDGVFLSRSEVCAAYERFIAGPAGHTPALCFLLIYRTTICFVTQGPAYKQSGIVR